MNWKNLLNKHYRALSVCIDFISKQEVTLHIILIFNAFVLTKNMKFVTFCAYKLFEKFFQKNDANWGNYFVEHSVCSSFLDPYTEPRIPKFRYSQVIFGGAPSLTKSENRWCDCCRIDLICAILQVKCSINDDLFMKRNQGSVNHN